MPASGAWRSPREGGPVNAEEAAEDGARLRGEFEELTGRCTSIRAGSRTKSLSPTESGVKTRSANPSAGVLLEARRPAEYLTYWRGGVDDSSTPMARSSV